MLRDGLQVELVASLSRLFFLRRLDPRDARHDLQRVHILVSIAAYCADCIQSRNLTDKIKISFRMESLFMLIMYAVYCVALSFNVKLERWAKS